MPIFDLSINVYVFLSLIMLSLVIGFMTRSQQLAKKQRRIMQLEREMIQAHAEVLENQRAYCELEARIQDVKNPVISMTNRPTGTAD